MNYIKDIHETPIELINGAIHVQCKTCRTNLVVIPGKVQSDNFELLVDNNDPMEIVYSTRCPYCGQLNINKAKELRVWKVN